MGSGESSPCTRSSVHTSLLGLPAHAGPLARASVWLHSLPTVRPAWACLLPNYLLLCLGEALLPSHTAPGLRELCGAVRGLSTQLYQESLLLCRSHSGQSPDPSSIARKGGGVLCSSVPQPLGLFLPSPPPFGRQSSVGWRGQQQ